MSQDSENIIYIDSRVDLTQFQQDLKKADLIARDTGKKLEKNLLTKLELNVADYQRKIKEAKKQRKELKDGSLETLKLDLNINRYSRKFTEAKRQLNNYVNNGEIKLSRLQRKFNSLKGSIISVWTVLKSAFIFTFVSFFRNYWRNVSEFWKEFELAFVWVKKTVEWSTKELGTLKKKLIDITFQTGKTFKEVAGIAELWWQLWVAIEDLEKFTKVITDISVSTNLTEEAAAKSFARISNILQEPLDDIDKMGSAVVGLWNNFATTEAEILSFAERIAWAWKIAWLTSSDIFWIATAFSSVWIEAEAWGTAVQKTLLKMNNAVNNGGKELQKFAKLSWRNAEEFAHIWKTDASKWFELFVNGLWKAWDDASNILWELIWNDVRLQRAFLSLANAWNLVNQTLETSNQAFRENSALTNEASKRYETFAIRSERLKREQEALYSSIHNSNSAIWNLILSLKAWFIWAQKGFFTIVEAIKFGFETIPKFIELKFVNLLLKINKLLKPLEKIGIKIDFTSNIEKRSKQIQSELDSLKQNAKKNILNINLPTATPEDIRNQRSYNTWYKKSNELIETNQDLIQESQEWKKDLTKIYKEYNKKVDDGQDLIQKYYESIIDGAKKSKNSVSDLMETQKDLQKELSKATQEKDTSIAERKLEILEQQKELEQEMSVFKGKGVNINLAKGISENALIELRDARFGTTQDTWENLLQVKRILEKQQKLKRESLILEKNLDKKVFIQIQEYKELSETERILRDYQQFEQNQNQKLTQVQEDIDQEQTLYGDMVDIKQHLEENFTWFIKDQTLERVGELEKIKQKAIEVAKELRSLWFEWKIPTSTLLNAGKVDTKIGNTWPVTTNNAKYTIHIDAKERPIAQVMKELKREIQKENLLT